jgi:hypothetical protein
VRTPPRLWRFHQERHLRKRALLSLYLLATRTRWSLGSRAWAGKWTESLRTPILARFALESHFSRHLLNFFCKNLWSRYPALRAVYSKAIRPPVKIPELGNWLRNAALSARVPKASKWFLDVDDDRVKGEPAHAKAKTSGGPTRPIPFVHAERLLRRAQTAWAEMIIEWRTIL